MRKCKEYNTYNVLCNECDYPKNINCFKKHMFRNLKEDLQIAIDNDYDMEIITYDDEIYNGTICEFTDETLTIVNSVLVVEIIHFDDIKNYKLLD